MTIAPAPGRMTAAGPDLEPLPAGAHLLCPLLDWAERQPDRILAGTRHGQEIGWVSAAEFAARVRRLAKGLIGAGIGPGDRVALMSR
ncbi:MAG TPA: AMP-binding protein, partial [Acidimicrobiia bacterium]|nr:AMP-binding protein [Acidimicrobiia bacterium]